MKVAILAGGYGTRFGKLTEHLPKPMIPVGPYPILWHIMRGYAHFGFDDFVLCLGYKASLIKDYFLNFEVYNNDFTLDFARPEDQAGIAETLSIDQCLHSLFGASKAAADLLVQEYGKYFGMPTVCFRGGCLTGPNHSGVELHGFLNHLVNVAVQDRTYRIFGYGGKQVRDQIHSCDVVRAMELFMQAPRPGEVYNLGGGRDSNASIVECLEMLSLRLGRPVKSEYLDAPRRGDHICYISNMAKFRSHYPAWELTRHVEDILDEMLEQKMRSPEPQAAVLTEN